MTRQEIIDLIHNEYDPAPAHYKMGDNWDDGSGRIADAVMNHIERMKAALQKIAKRQYGEPWDVIDIARAALAPEMDNK